MLKEVALFIPVVMATIWVTPALTAVFIQPTLDLQASYCTVSFFPITLHHQCSVLLPDSIPFFFLSASPPPSDVSICTQFLRCKSFNWMDERPQPIHHRSYPLPSPLFLHHPVVNLTSDVPVSFLSFFPSLPSPHPLSISLSVPFPSPPCTTETSAALSAQAVKAL